MFESGKLVELNINDILPNRFQPRIYFNENKLNQLAESIHKYGVIQPIVVREVNNKYEIIAGERRYKASKLANRQSIPAIIVNLTDRESEEIALLENIQRQELTPIEEAVSYKRILDMGYITEEGLAKKIGKSQMAISNKVKLLNLDDEVQEALLYGKISERHARSLLKINNRSLQKEMLKRIINERLTVKRTDEEIAKLLNNAPVISNASSNVVTPVTNVENLFDNNEISVNNNIRKEDNMDIDRIMREAKDINVPEAQNDVSKLMQNPNAPVYNTPAPSPVPTPEPTDALSGNKFVHYAPEEPTPAPVQTVDHTNFNNMFHPTASSLQNSAPAPSVTEMPTVMPTSSPAPVATSPIASAVNEAFNARDNIGSVNSASNYQEQPYQTNPVNSIPEVSPYPEASIYQAKPVNNIPEANPYQNVNNYNAVNQNPVPSADIYEEPVTQASMVSEPVKTVSTPNLMEAIHLIRNCASQIEALGIKINVDEMDLEGNYKVTFDITK